MQANMWEPSPAPEETWSDASGGNENGEWPVKGIVGEEGDTSGVLRCATVSVCKFGFHEFSQIRSRFTSLRLKSSSVSEPASGSLGKLDAT